MDNVNGQMANVEEAVSVKEWVITMLILCVPIVNFVMIFVWAFGGSTKRSKANYFKATLLVAVIAIVLSIIILIIMAVAGVSVMDNFSNY